MSKKDDRMYAKAFAQLERLYADLDRALADEGAICDGCGVCCHFDQVDHILYASRLERDYLAAVPAPPPGPTADPALVARGLRCPYQQDNACRARNRRPLGCRLHFCRRPGNSFMAEDDFCEQWHAGLKQLHRDAGLEWRYAPLLPLAGRE